MQDAIQKKLGLSPVEENVIVLYDGEKDARKDEFWKVLKFYIICTLHNICTCQNSSTNINFSLNLE